MTGGALVREARLRAGLTQAALAARVGTTQSAVARVEGGGTSPAYEQIERLVAACGLELYPRLVAASDDGAWASVRANLALTVTERVAQLVDAVDFVQSGRRALADRRPPPAAGG